MLEYGLLLKACIAVKLHVKLGIMLRCKLFSWVFFWRDLRALNRKACSQRHSTLTGNCLILNPPIIAFFNPAVDVQQPVCRWVLALFSKKQRGGCSLSRFNPPLQHPGPHGGYTVSDGREPAEGDRSGPGRKPTSGSVPGFNIQNPDQLKKTLGGEKRSNWRWHVWGYYCNEPTPPMCKMSHTGI